MYLILILAQNENCVNLLTLIWFQTTFSIIKVTEDWGMWAVKPQNEKKKPSWSVQLASFFEF